MENDETTISIEADVLLAHMCLTTNMPDALIAVLAKQGIEVDLKKINQLEKDIIATHLYKTDPSTGLITILVLLKNLYHQYSQNSTTQLSTEAELKESSLKKRHIKEYVTGYN